jgi:anthranilate synthase/aminodeoxychorismate synthase-like glutamine amidotransferase
VPAAPPPLTQVRSAPRGRILVIDNYDSFVYNLVQYLGELGAEPIVHRHDAIDLAEVDRIQPDGILISPGPGRPHDAGLSNELIAGWGRQVPVFGVCLGQQCIGEVFGGRVVRAPEIVHGRTSLVHHDGRGVFEGLPEPLEATRYHSLIVERASLPPVLEVSAETDDGLVMGLRHRELPIEGVQFHPESVLTVAGHEMLDNVLRRCDATR